VVKYQVLYKDICTSNFLRHSLTDRGLKFAASKWHIIKINDVSSPPTTNTDLLDYWSVASLMADHVSATVI